MSGLVKISKVRKSVNIPSAIFEDANISLNAKGLYVQLCASSDVIYALDDIPDNVTNTLEEVSNIMDELIEHGYVTQDKSGKFHLREKPMVRKRDVTETKSAIKTTKVLPDAPKKTPAEFIRDSVNTSDFSKQVKTLLIDYFMKRLTGEDRFSTAPLHKPMVVYQIESLKKIRDEYSLSQEELELCVKQSIDNYWFKFVWPIAQQKSQFDRKSLVSGSYSKDEIEEIKRKAKERLEEGI